MEGGTLQSQMNHDRVGWEMEKLTHGAAVRPSRGVFCIDQYLENWL